MAGAQVPSEWSDMNPRRRHKPGVNQELWFKRTWEERHTELVRIFGPLKAPDLPEGWVYRFEWEELGLGGACAMCFPPSGERGHWLYVTHGLTQPENADEVKAKQAAGDPRSGYGLELALALPESASWAPPLLMQMMAHVTQGNVIEAGTRLAVAGKQGEKGPEPWYEAGRGVPNISFWALYWPLLDGPKEYQTATGTFRILALTLVTPEEFVLARKTSTAHMLLLLLRAGMGQVSRPGRPTLTRDPKWAELWNSIAAMDAAAVTRALRGE